MTTRPDKLLRVLARTIGRGIVLGGVCLLIGGCHHWQIGGRASCENPTCKDCAEGTCHPLCCVSCEDYSRCVDEHFATREAIRRANRSLRKCYEQRPSFDFQDGYRHAFIDIATGGDGRIPAVPPERYWSTCYRTAAGHQRAQNWYAGFVAGANRAGCHCRYRYNDVPASGVPAFEPPSEHQVGWQQPAGEPSPSIPAYPPQW